MENKNLAKRKLESLYLSGEREVPIMGSQADVHSETTPEAPMAMLPEQKTKSIPLPSKPQSRETVYQKSSADKQGLLDQLRADVGECTRCRLCEQRTHIVFGVGNPAAELMFVGEAPGRDEDQQGEPFVGRAGQLLTKIIEAMKYTRGQIYIANVVKCRPPENRNPAPDEISTCGPFLLRQIEIIRPKVIVGLGNFAVQTLLQTEAKITGLRGHFHPWPSSVVKAKFDTALGEGSIQLMPTYHPAFLLRNPNMKRPVWEDMQKVMELLNKK